VPIEEEEQEEEEEMPLQYTAVTEQNFSFNRNILALQKNAKQ
jgi:hypothetical protein